MLRSNKELTWNAVSVVVILKFVFVLLDWIFVNRDSVLFICSYNTQP
jgi:hypothetical protein